MTATGLIDPSPRNFPIFPTARNVMPGRRSLGFPVTVKHFVTFRAGSLPLPVRHFDVRPIADKWLGTDFAALGFPDFIVAVADADQSMGDFVQESVADVLERVSRHVMDAEFDAAGLAQEREETDARPPQVVIEAEPPFGKPVVLQQDQGHDVYIDDFLCHTEWLILSAHI
jgi:hypothetical protein